MVEILFGSFSIFALITVIMVLQVSKYDTKTMNRYHTRKSEITEHCSNFSSCEKQFSKYSAIWYGTVLICASHLDLIALLSPKMFYLIKI